MVFKKKKSKEETKNEETATVANKEQKPEETQPQGKLLIDMTEPERFIYVYQELIEIKTLMAELVQIVKEE